MQWHTTIYNAIQWYIISIYIYTYLYMYIMHTCIYNYMYIHIYTCIVLYCIVLYYIMFYYILSYYIILYYILLYLIILYDIRLYYYILILVDRRLPSSGTGRQGWHHYGVGLPGRWTGGSPPVMCQLNIIVWVSYTIHIYIYTYIYIYICNIDIFTNFSGPIL